MTADVLVGYEPPEKQNRLTVAFRAVLAIPHFLFLIVLGFVVEVVVVISWFAALFLGRIPDGMHTFIGRLIRYSTRVYAYVLLLTDRYPPFDLSTDDYPVSVSADQTRLNRAAVFFRIILQIPAYIVLVLVQSGMQIAAFFIWLIVLIAGRMPRSLFEAVAATLRYQTRYYAYMSLVTPTYPAGLLGDKPYDPQPFTATPEDRPPAFPAADPPPAPPAYADAPPPLPGSTPAPPPPPPTRPRATRLVLSRGGKRLVVLFIVLGVLYIGGFVVAAATISPTTTRFADVTDARATLDDALRQYRSQEANCQSDLNCLQLADVDLATAFEAFSDDLMTMSFSSSQQPAAEDCEASARAVALFLNRQGSGSTARSPVQAARYQELGNNFDQAYRRLIDTL